MSPVNKHYNVYLYLDLERDLDLLFVRRRADLLRDRDFPLELLLSDLDRLRLYDRLRERERLRLLERDLERERDLDLERDLQEKPIRNVVTCFTRPLIYNYLLRLDLPCRRCGDEGLPYRAI